jgi:hypothetical protein
VTSLHQIRSYKHKGRMKRILNNLHRSICMLNYHKQADCDNVYKVNRNIMKYDAMVSE